MRLETPIIALVVASLIFTGFYTVFISDLGSTYGAEMNLSVFTTQAGDTSLEDSFNQLNKTKSDMDALTEDFSDEKVTDSGSLFGFLKLTWTIGKQMLDSVNVLKSMLYGLSGLLGIPPMFVTGGILIIIITMVISIVMVLAGRTY